MPPEDQSRIEDLKQSLYSRNAPDVRTRRKLRFSDVSTDLKQDWEHPPEASEEAKLNAAYKDTSRHGMSLVTKIFLGSLVFCVVAVGAGAFIFLKGGNFVSANNIEIDMSGPVSVPGGAPVKFGITIVNKNTVTLKTVDLAIQFPPGTTDPNDTTQSLEQHQEVIGDIPPGGSITKSIDAVIFGEENTQKQVSATVTYGISGSTSVFTKVASYDVLVNASPVVITTSSLTEAISGQPFDLTATVKSDSANTIKNVILRATYPFGFSFLSSSVRPAGSDNNVWAIGDIPPGGERAITIHGTLSGEDTDLRVFHFATGARDPVNPLVIGTTFMETEQDVSIQKPFMSLAFAVDGDASTTDHVGMFDRSESVSVKWSNNLPEAISNVIITAHLSGSAYDKDSVSAWGGYFRSATDDVIWNQQTDPELASVPSGASGVLSFSLTPKDPLAPDGHTVNPIIVMSGSATGDRSGQTNVPLNTGSIARNVRIASKVSLSGRVVRGAGAFVNSGPIPPVAEQATTYTIVWSVDNTASAIGGAAVTATLPPYVSWLGHVSPGSEDVEFDKNSGVVTWNIGSLNAVSGGASNRREAQFQVSLEPSVDKIGQAPVLVNTATLNATDAWTSTPVTSNQGYLTTSYSTDPSYHRGDETVVKAK